MDTYAIIQLRVDHVVVELVWIFIERSLAQQLERVLLVVCVASAQLVVFFLLQQAEVLTRLGLVAFAMRALVGLRCLFPRRHRANCGYSGSLRRTELRNPEATDFKKSYVLVA